MDTIPSRFVLAPVAAVLFASSTPFVPPARGMEPMTVLVRVLGLEGVEDSAEVPVWIAVELCPDLDMNALTSEQRMGLVPIGCTVTPDNATRSFLEYLQRKPVDKRGSPPE